MRITLIGLFVVPLVSLVALWGFAANITLSSAIRDHNFNTATKNVAPAIEGALGEISLEQQQTYVWLSIGRSSPPAALDATRKRTDLVVGQARRSLASVRGLLPASAGPGLSTFITQLDRLPGIRAAVDSGRLSPSAALQDYSDITDVQFDFLDSVITADSVPIYQQVVGSIDGYRVLELIGRQAALVSGALATHGQMSRPARELFAAAVANQRLLAVDGLALLGPDLRSGYARAYRSPAYQQLTAMQNRIDASIGSPGPVPVNAHAWASATMALTAHSGARPGNCTLSWWLTSPNHLSSTLTTEAALAGGVGLIAVLVSVLLLLRFGRRLTGELGSLHDGAQTVAEERLPSVVDRLRRGEEVNVAAESPPLAAGRISEIAKVTEAFSSVQRTAVEAAVGQANLRKGVNQVFLNLSLRNQSLLHRQLGMLDSMERATNEPAALADLFRLDHLTTRMRRHAEGLIILSGATPARGWRDPVPVVDVLRAAIAEVEDYVRGGRGQRVAGLGGRFRGERRDPPGR